MPPGSNAAKMKHSCLSVWTFKPKELALFAKSKQHALNNLSVTMTGEGNKMYHLKFLSTMRVSFAGIF
jgi:hypothetical protein